MVGAELQVVLLRPEPPGRLITQGGDIDNRVKTLFDSLTMPRHPAQDLPAGITPTADEAPFFYCLLEDDNLVTAVDVRTDQLLEPGVDPSEIEATIVVKTRTFAKAWGNSAF
jgi:hypothetical protein